MPCSMPGLLKKSGQIESKEQEAELPSQHTLQAEPGYIALCCPWEGV